MRLFTANWHGISQKSATSGDHIRKVVAPAEIVLSHGPLGIELRFRYRGRAASSAPSRIAVSFFTPSIDASLIALGPGMLLGLYLISSRKREYQLASFFVELRSDSIAESPSAAQRDKKSLAHEDGLMERSRMTPIPGE